MDQQTVEPSLRKHPAWEAFSARICDQNKFAIKLGLNNIRKALDLEGNPETFAPAIVVGGTNGKGETSATISRILTHHGLNVGLFTSPHLIEFRERFRVNGVPASRDDVMRVGEYVLKKYGDPKTCEEKGHPCLTFFELSVLIAALFFREKKVDVIVWEVGMGGRLDATNAIEPSMTVITNIGIDHTAYLGDTIESITNEKAGLIRKDVCTIIAPQSYEEARDLLIGKSEQTYEVPNLSDPFDNRSTGLFAAKTFLTDPSVKKNFSKKITFDESIANQAAQSLTWWGRQQAIQLNSCTYYIDGAHNPLGFQRFRRWLASKTDTLDLLFIAGMKDKDLHDMFGWINDALNPNKEKGLFIKKVCCLTLETERAADFDTMKSVIPTLDDDAHIAASDIGDYLGSHAYKRVAACGSLYMIGEFFCLGMGYSSDDFII